jgi:hypothetical protein
MTAMSPRRVTESMLGSVTSTKYSRSLQLIGWGLNSPAYTCFRPNPEVKTLPVLDIVHYMEKHNVSTVSIRELVEFGQGKVLSGIDRAWMVDNLDTMAKLGPFIMCPGIDPEDCVFAGCVMVYGGDFLMEVIDGPAKVSDLTRGKLNPRITVKSRFGSDMWRSLTEFQLVQVIEEIQKIPISNFIVEFSVYNKRIGKYRSHRIYWDYEVLGEI